MKKEIITIGGMLGSGKSTTAGLLAKRLGYEMYSAGELMRQLAKERGYNDIRDFNIASEGRTDADTIVDQRTAEVGETHNRLVFEGHMAWRFIPSSFKVFLMLDSETAAARIISGMTRERKATEHVPDDPREFAALLEERKASNERRYREQYEVNPYQLEHYDCVIDTTHASVEQVVDAITTAYHQWLHG